MEDKINEFVKKGGEPSDEEMTELAKEWRKYISQTNPVRSIHCEKDFMMGMILMAKRLLEYV